MEFLMTRHIYLDLSNNKNRLKNKSPYSQEKIFQNQNNQYVRK